MQDLRSDEKKFAEKKEEKSAAETKALTVCKKCNRIMLHGKCWDDQHNISVMYYCPYCKTYEDSN